MGEIRLKVPRLRKIAGSWYWRPSKSLCARGYKSIPLGKDTALAIQKAEKQNARVDAELRGETPPIEPGSSVADMIQLFLVDPMFVDLPDDEKHAYRGVLNEIAQQAGAISIIDITRLRIVQLLQARHEAAVASGAQYIAVWRDLLDVALDEGLRSDNPACRIRVPPVRRTPQHSLAAAVLPFPRRPK